MSVKRKINVATHLVVPGVTPTVCGIAEIDSTTEKWKLAISCTYDNLVMDRELAQFTFCLPNGRTFSGTIQDIQAIEVFARNARKELMEYAQNGFTDKTDEAEVLDTIKEVDVLLSMFK
jgi:hypothetical protein